jgi:hydrogenase maturation protease
LEHLESASIHRAGLVDTKIQQKPKIAVLGVGNILLKDEGIGVHIAHKLVDIIDPQRVEIIDSGTFPYLFTLLNENIEKLIVIDAVSTGEPPGTTFSFNLCDLKLSTNLPVSLHEIGLAENLSMLTLLCPRLKSVVILGVEAKEIEYGLEISPEVREKIPRIIELVMEEIEKISEPEEVYI